MAAGADDGFEQVRTPDERTLEVLTGGDPGGTGLLYHSGSPSAAVRYEPIWQAAYDAGLRLVTYSRPGYGGSTPRPTVDGRPARIADDADDVAVILDALGVEDFVTFGWSGGGPRALACAALLSDRCRAVATLAGVAPIDGEGLDWLAGMAPENVSEYTAAREGAEAYGAYLEREFAPMATVTPEQLHEGLGELLTPVDQAATTGELAAYLAEMFHRALAQGVVGTRDDGLVAMAPWGFDVASIRVPVAIWQGRQDAMVPFAHGQWLATHVAGAEPHLFDDEGHVTLLHRVPEILADLKRLASV